MTSRPADLGELVERVREAKDNPIAAFLSPEQRQLFEETQRVMSLLEGFSDWVMDEVGAQVLPDVRTIRDRFEARRSKRRGPFDRLVARVTGLDLKLEQYRRGERFVSGVAAAGGREAIDALWSGPWALPTEQELADPSAWVRRVMASMLRLFQRGRPRPTIDEYEREHGGHANQRPGQRPCTACLLRSVCRRSCRRATSRSTWRASPMRRRARASSRFRSRAWPTATCRTSKCCFAGRCRRADLRPTAEPLPTA